MAPLIPGAERRHVEIDSAEGGRLRIHVTELGAGPPVLMLHGWPQHAGAWHRLAPLMAGDHRLICPDLRGFGSSDAPGRGYDPQTFAADALALLDSLGIERAFLVGHDWGGFSGFLACISAPQRFDAFLALNTPVPWPRQTPKLLLEAWRSWYAVVMASPAGPWVVERAPGLLAKGMRSDLVHPEAISQQEALEYARRLARPASAQATQQLYRSYLRSVADSFRDEPPGRLSVPTRLLFGANDGAVSKELIKGYETHADEMEVELVDDSGHFIAEEKPELVAERALELFRGVRARG